MLFSLSEFLTQYYSGFNVFGYLTMRTILGVLTALVISLLGGCRIFIVWTGGSGRGGQRPSASRLLWSDLSSRFVWIVLFVTVGFGVIGWIDDYKKIVFGNSAGLSARAKYFWQSVVGLGAALALYYTAQFPIETQLIVPFLKNILIDLGWIYIVLTYFVIVGSSNAVNLTDGLDGLAILPTVLVGGALGVFAYLTGNFNFSNYLGIPYVPGVGEMVVFCGALVGAGLGFLWFNTYPAQVFIMGGIFVVETVSVMLQVASFKLTGRRIFRMAPLHHHYELKGWPEPRIIVRFWIITVVLVLIGLASLKIR